MQPEPVSVRTMRTRYDRQCAYCRGWIQPGAFLVVVVYQTVSTVWYCVLCALALGLPRPQTHAVEG